MSDANASDWPIRSGVQRRVRALTPDELRAAIEDELIDRGVPGRLTLYGGAAMALVHYERAATADIDASFFPPDEVAASGGSCCGASLV